VSKTASGERPVPIPDTLSSVYWDGARSRRLVLRRCQSCGALQHPPRASCVGCGAEGFEAQEVSGSGRIASFVVVNDTTVPGFADMTPYVLGAIQIEEEPALRIYGIVRAAPGEVEIGMLVSVVWEELPDGTVLPEFSVAGVAS
jgi:uncharacterized OB-fold protein